MALSHDLITQFAKVVKEDKKKSSETTVYGTVVTDGNGNKYVKLDGSDQLTPLSDDERPSADSTTTSANAGERVSVLIKNHTATVTGNISTPSARSDDVKDLGDQVAEIKKFDIVLADKVQANEGYIKSLQTDKASVGDLTTATARITELETKKASIEELNAAKAEITDLKTTKIDADVANAKFATIENLDATNAEVDSLSATHAAFETATADNFSAVNADIDNLEATKLTAEQAELKFANIDFGNITEAAVKKLFTDSGIIKDLVVSEGHITGELVGVTIKGDLIEGGTVKAGKLVILGEDGLYYKLNVDSLGETTVASDPKYQNGLDGSVIIAKSVTAEKVMVDDLVAFGATIGGINISDNTLYSGVKSSADNTTRGFYLDKDGQLVVGDANNFLKYYKDANGDYKLEISASSVSIRSGGTTKSVESAINAVETRVTKAETAIDQNKEAIALRATKTEVTNYVASRGENLVTNGTALLGDNTNFSSFTYDGAESYYSGGSFKVEGSSGSVMFTDEYIPVDMSQVYKLSYWIKSNSSTALYYDFIDMYDIDKKCILASNVMYIAGSLTTLSQELKNGDTVVHLQSVAGFNKDLPYYWNHGLIFWNYKNSKGHQYGIETYSRNIYDSLWDDATAFDTENNTIALKTAWTKGTFPAGTAVSQSSDGGSYVYLNGDYKVASANTWTQKTGSLSGIGKNEETRKFREGTAFIRVGWLINHGNISSVTTHISTVSLTQNAGISDIDNVRDSVDAQGTTLTKTITDHVAALQTNADSISASVEKLQTTVTEDLDGLRDDISTIRNKVDLQLTEDEVNIQIDKKLQNGVTKVETSTGFKFDENGLNISKSESPTNTQITENGMTVNNTETGDSMLTADKDGVDAKNLRASTYLIVGGRSRFENYGTNRTGCFWIGE
jgi:hypothetical protein